MTQFVKVSVALVSVIAALIGIPAGVFAILDATGITEDKLDQVVAVLNEILALLQNLNTLAEEGIEALRGIE